MTLAPTPSPTSVPTFVATGKMNHPRAEATSTLLADGRVLIAGGVDDVGVPVFHFVDSAELYDQATHAFTPTGSMTTTRARAAAILLADGRVLVLGGEGCRDSAKCTERDWAGSTIFKSAELYDPKTGKFTPTGSMAELRAGASAMLLPDGRVLVLSGNSRLVEIYDSATGRFTRAGSLLNEYHAMVKAVLLPGGKVLVVGDQIVGTYGQVAAELFDPASGESESISVGPLSQYGTAAVGVYTATLLRDGRALVQINADLWTYDPMTGKFTASGSLPWQSGAAALLNDGRVLFAGGGNFASPDDSAGLYDPASGLHQLDSKMLQMRGDQTMTTLPDGTILIAGGILLGDEAPTSAELFRP